MIGLIPLLLGALAQADPVAQRSPVDGELVAVVGAPVLGVAGRIPTGKDREQASGELIVSASVRVPSASTDLSVGLRTRGGAEEVGWAWAAGLSAGLIALRDPDVGLSLAPWARLERKGSVHGGVQVAAPIAARRTGGLRLPVLGELFVGSRRDRVHVLAVGGAGWAFLPGTPAGVLVLQGGVHVGVALD